MKPKIDIIVPIYNDYGAYQAYCYKGLLNQSFKDFMVILIDDGSTDHPHLCVTDKFPTMFFKHEHHGSNWARNEGFFHAQAETIIFLDADVELLPTALERMYEALGSWASCQWVYSQFFIQRPYQNEHNRTHYLSRTPNLDAMKQQNYIALPSLIKTKYFLGFDEDLDCWQDWDLWLRMMNKGIRAHFIPEPLYVHYWGRPNSITETRDHAAASHLMHDKHRFNIPIKCHCIDALLQKTIARNCAVPLGFVRQKMAERFGDRLNKFAAEDLLYWLNEHYDFIYKGEK